jgi:hypothetical protein
MPSCSVCVRARRLALAATWHARDKIFPITGNHYLHIYPGNPKEVLVGDGIHAEPLGILLGAHKECVLSLECVLSFNTRARTTKRIASSGLMREQLLCGYLNLLFGGLKVLGNVVLDHHRHREAAHVNHIFRHMPRCFP